MRKVICSVLLFATALLAVVYKDVVSSAQDSGGERTVVMLNGEPAYLDTFNRPGVEIEYVNRPTMNVAKNVAPATRAEPHVAYKMKHVSELHDSDLAKTTNSKGYVLLQFGAPYCSGCVALKPTLDQYAADAKGTVNVYHIDKHECPEFSGYFNVGSLPNLIILKDGKEVANTIGDRSCDSLKAWAEKYITAPEPDVDAIFSAADTKKTLSLPPIFTTVLATFSKYVAPSKFVLDPNRKLAEYNGKLYYLDTINDEHPVEVPRDAAAGLCQR